MPKLQLVVNEVVTATWCDKCWAKVDESEAMYFDPPIYDTIARDGSQYAYLCRRHAGELGCRAITTN